MYMYVEDRKSRNQTSNFSIYIQYASKKSGQRYGKGNGTTVPVPFKYPPRTVQIPLKYRFAYTSDTLEVPFSYLSDMHVRSRILEKVHVGLVFMHNHVY